MQLFFCDNRILWLPKVDGLRKHSAACVATTPPPVPPHQVAGNTAEPSRPGRGVPGWTPMGGRASAALLKDLLGRLPIAAHADEDEAVHGVSAFHENTAERNLLRGGRVPFTRHRIEFAAGRQPRDGRHAYILPHERPSPRRA